jgi:hypothetical protein
MHCLISAAWLWLTDHATIVSTVVTGAATVAIAIFTIKLSKATNSQLLHNRAVERAHVFVKGLAPTSRLDTNGRVMAWRIVPILGNSGNTPTRNALVHVSSQVRPDELPDDFNFEDQWSPGEPHKNIPISIGPGAEVWCATQEFHLVDVWHAQQGTGHIYVWGWVDYDDTFEDTARHRTEFCYKLMIVGDPNINNPAHISFRTYREHNGTDTECFRKPAPYLRPTRKAR